MSRRRTQFAFGFLVALPLILVGAFALGDDPGEDGAGPARGTEGAAFVDLAQGGAANFTIFTLFASTGFLLVVLVALFVGDTVPSEASWSTLRYLLTAPVPRRRLLVQKLMVGLLTGVAALVVLPAWSLLVGGIAYGWGDFADPLGRTLSWDVFLFRLVVIVGYLAVHLLFVACAGFLIGMMTDAPLGAVGGAVLITIVSAILDSISALGDFRNALPTHYQYAWLEALDQSFTIGDMDRGALWAVGYAAVLLTAAFVVFERKDVLS